MSDLRVIRERQLIASATADNAAGRQDSYGSAAICAITTTIATYPTSAAEFFACNPELITGAEVEGGAATFTVDTSTVLYGINVGTAIPPNGTKIVIHAVGGRWVFRYDG